MYEMTIPVESESDISFVLNGQGGQSTQPVTLHLTITVSANRAPPSDPPKTAAQGDDSPGPAEEVPKIEPPSPPPEHPPTQSDTPIPQDQAEMSLAEKTRISLDRAVQAEKSIERAWEGVEWVKFVTDTLSPLTRFNPITQKVVSVIPTELSKQRQRDDNVRALLKSMHDAFDFATHEDTLRSINPQSRQAEVLTLMLQDICRCSDFIQEYAKDSQFSMRTLKNMGSGVEEKVQELSTALVEHRRAFLDHAVITASRRLPKARL